MNTKRPENIKKPEFITVKETEIINGVKAEWSKQIERQPYLLQPVRMEMNFVEKPIRAIGEIFTKYKRKKNQETGEGEHVLDTSGNKIPVSQFVVFFCPETGLRYKHGNISNDLKLFLGSPNDDNWVLGCKGEMDKEPEKEKQLNAEGKEVYVKVGERDYFKIIKWM